MKEGEEALELGVRNKIYKVVNKNPGVHFREIERRTNLAVGSLQYHLEFLEKAHLVRREKQGKFIRYFAVRGKQLGENEEVMSILRQEHFRKIIIYLLTSKKRTNYDIAKNLSFSPSTISMHLKKLVEAGIVGKKKRSRKIRYYVIDAQRIADVLIGYRKSFLDEIVDNFVEVWQDLEP